MSKTYFWTPINICCILLFPYCSPAQKILSEQIPSVKVINYNQNKSLVGWIHLNPNEIKVMNTDSTWSMNIGSANGGIKCFAFHPTEKKIVIGFYNGMLELWDISTPQVIWSVAKHHQQINDVKFSPKGDFLLTCSSDKTIRLSWARDGSFIKEYYHTSQVNAAEFYPLNPAIFLTADHEGNIVYWKINQPKKLRVIKAHTNYVFDLKFYSDGDKLLSSGHDQVVRAWNYKSGELLKEFKGHTNVVYSIDISDDEYTFASGSFDKKICLWDYHSGKKIKCYTGHSDYINVVRFTPDGLVVSGSRDGTIRLWKN